MDNHPIPQDITGFQFKLVGNMTVKQFIYLAAGVVPAWFIFFILPIFFIIKLPLALIFLGFGTSLAFVPVDGRPMDTMILNLIKALFAPTQYIYKKTPAVTETQRSPQKTQKETSVSSVDKSVSSVSAMPQVQMQPPPPPPPPPPQPIQQTQPPAPPPPPPPSPTPVGTVVEFSDSSPRPVLSGNLDDLVNPATSNVVETTTESTEKSTETQREEAEDKKVLEEEKKLEEEVSTLEEQLEEAKALENTETNLANLSLAHRKTQEVEKLLAETARQKEALEKELMGLRAKLESQQEEKFTPTTAKPLRQTQRVRKVPPGMEKSVGLPSAPQEPNLITGIVKDPRGNPLPNILVEVKDTEDNPVRAFKTNGLGQFASATSLSNGKYIVSFEDPEEKHKFDAVQIEATGSPIMPLEIISIDAREELRRELFN